MLPLQVVCPNCNSEFELEEDERKAGKIHCPDCESYIDFTTDPPIIKKPKEYTQIFTSLNQGDIGLIKSILDDANIDFYVLGENFLSIDPLLQPVRFFILSDRVSDAKELLKDFDFKIFGTSTNQNDIE
ncbi:MAG TPA: hypothetical protein VLN45_12360 [Ignavibacteriaceae bacterium]|nr:hypothetical protein [Ignavibacteriaceae bacterium]